MKFKPIYIVAAFLLLSCSNNTNTKNNFHKESPQKSQKQFYKRESLQEKFRELKFPPYHNSEVKVIDSIEIRFVEDSLLLKDIYVNAKWLTYCLSYSDTFYFTKYAREKFKFPQFSPICNENLVLDYLGGVSMHIQGKKQLANYSISIKPENFYYESDSVIISPKNDKWHFRKYVFLTLHYASKYPDAPIAIKSFSQLYDPLNPLWTKECKLIKALQIIQNPFQPEIIKHVRQNSSHIHPWFLNEAKKRGMFDSAKYTPEWVEKEISLNKQKPKNCDEETIRTR